MNRRMKRRLSMSPFPVAKKFSRTSILVVLAALVLAWTGGSSATAEEPVPSLAAPNFEAFLFSEADCIAPTENAAELPALFPQPQPRGASNCSPLCGYVPCRGMLIGEACTKATGAAGTCYGPPMGKQCADGLPMCLCV
jgi:hypothetical protein